MWRDFWQDYKETLVLTGQVLIVLAIIIGAGAAVLGISALFVYGFWLLGVISIVVFFIVVTVVVTFLSRSGW